MPGKEDEKTSGNVPEIDPYFQLSRQYTIFNFVRYIGVGEMKK